MRKYRNGRATLSGGGLIIELGRKQIGAWVIMLSLAMSSTGADIVIRALF